MKQFKDLGIEPPAQGFTGDKIRMDRILNREIIVHDFKIENSKYEKGNGKCLYMQIQLNNVKHVVFTGSTSLMETIQKVPKSAFPFKTTIIKDNERFEFT